MVVVAVGWFGTWTLRPLTAIIDDPVACIGLGTEKARPVVNANISI